jgi:hypothetical protein
VNLSLYAAPQVNFEVGAHDCSWLVFYEKQGSIVPMHSDVFVSVSDVSGFVTIHGKP